MIIKKFQGKTEAEAVENAKKELGNGIVIMNVRNVKKKGLFSFLRQQLVEVTVALEEEPVRPTGIPEPNRNLTDAIANIRSVSEKSLQQEAAEKKRSRIIRMKSARTVQPLRKSSTAFIFSWSSRCRSPRRRQRIRQKTRKRSLRVKWSSL